MVTFLDPFPFASVFYYHRICYENYFFQYTLYVGIRYSSECPISFTADT